MEGSLADPVGSRGLGVLRKSPRVAPAGLKKRLVSAEDRERRREPSPATFQRGRPVFLFSSLPPIAEDVRHPVAHVDRAHVRRKTLEELRQLLPPGPGGRRGLRIDLRENRERLEESLLLGDRSTGIAIRLLLLATMTYRVPPVGAEILDHAAPDLLRELGKPWLVG